LELSRIWNDFAMLTQFLPLPPPSSVEGLVANATKATLACRHAPCRGPHDRMEEEFQFLNQDLGRK
jgi:hypothetical protein